jgi:hypothetical protein
VVGNSELDYDRDDFGPAGELAAASAQVAIQFAMDGEFGDLFARAFATGHEQNDDWGQDVELRDMEALTSTDVASMQIRAAAASLGYRLDEAMAQAPVPVLVSQAWLTLSNWGDDTHRPRSTTRRLGTEPHPTVGGRALVEASVLDVSTARGDSDDPVATLSLAADGGRRNRYGPDSRGWMSAASLDPTRRPAGRSPRTLRHASRSGSSAT